MVRPHRVLASLVLAAQTFACRAAEPTPEAAPSDAPTASTAAPRGLPLPLLDMLELVGDNPDYLILRDAQALLDAGVPWQAFVLAQAKGAEQAGFFVQLQKWVEGPDPPLARAGIDLRGGLVLTAVPRAGDLFVLASRDPSLTATLLTTLPFPHSDRTRCQPLAATPPYATCATDEAALTAYEPGNGAARRQALAAALPGVAIDDAMLVGSIGARNIWFADDIGVGQQTLHLHVGDDETMRAVDLALAPGPAELLRFVQPDVGFVWLRVDAPALRLLKPDVLGDEEPLVGLSNAWTGELLLSGLAEPAALQLRAGLTSTASAKDLLQLLSLDAADARPEPLEGFADAQIHRDAGTLQIAGESTPVLRLWVEGAPQISRVAESLGLAPRLSLFAAHGSLALVLGSDDPHAALPPQPQPEAALRGFPPAALADLRAGRVMLLAHAPLDALQSPQLRAALELATPHVDADSLRAIREALAGVAPLSRITVWGSETDGHVVWHITLTNIGNTADPVGQAALAAMRTAPEAAPAAFAALADSHPDAPLAAGYRDRAGRTGPESLSRSLFGALVVLAPVLERLAGDSAPVP